MNNHFLGNYTISKLKKIIEEENISKIFLVTNKNSFISSGINQHIFQNLVNCEYRRFTDFSVNPKFEELEAGLVEIEKFKPQLIIGVGGGSAMDMAKLLHFDSKLNFKLMCIPTTSGSGSEATQFAVYYKAGIKQTLDNKKILPDYVIVDGLLTENLPKNITAFTGIDAICQAIESFWAIARTEESMDYALKALEYLVPNIQSVVQKPTLETREKMALGSYYAGRAINITRTTAAHAFSYYLTSKYGYSHGHAVGLTLPYFIRVNADKVDLSSIYKIFNCKDAQSLVTYFQTLMNAIDLENDLLKIIKNDIDTFINIVDLDRLKNNPAHLTKKEFHVLFTQKLE